MTAEFCTCNKVRYATRKHAKYAARRAFPGAKGMRAYKCGPHWHVGRTPPSVLAGLKTAAEVYRRAAS